jgi:glycosyltransferase involved in cell wall biosynthesis
MRILLVNPAYDADLGPEELLDRYDTLTGWGEALMTCGAREVVTLQRFSRSLELMRGGVRYLFRADGGGPRPKPWIRPSGLLTVARDSKVDVVHANGLVFPALLWQLRQAVSRRVPLVVQHHAGRPPSLGRGPVDMWRRRVWRSSLAGVDAFFFTAADQVEPWRAAGLIRPEQRAFAIPETSRRMRPVSREVARRHSGFRGQPQLLWVGHLVAQKDPLTVIDGFAQALDSMPEAHLAFVYRKDDLLGALGKRLVAEPRLADRVRFLGPVPHDALPAILCGADVFVIGSHDEGSGYALIEALSCGLVPVVTDIPSFRALTGGGSLGALWTPGDAKAFARALLNVASRPLEPQRDEVTRHFEAELTWPAVGRRALGLYREVLEALGP